MVNEYFSDYENGSQEQTANSIKETLKDLEKDKLYLLKSISKSNGDYVVVRPGQDAIYMSKADALTKSETEKLVKEFIDNATFIAENENNPESNDCGIKEEISESTTQWNSVTTIFTSSDKLFIISNF